MIEVFSLLTTLFSDFISFLDNFKILNNLSLLRLLIILFIFNIALHFLVKNKRGE